MTSVRHVIAGCCLVLLLLPRLASSASDLADAAMERDTEVVRVLLKQRADVNGQQADGATALHWAVHWDNLEIADLLIEAGANVRAANRFQVTPMSLALINGSAAMIKKLLKAGIDPNAVVSELGETPLMMASRAGAADAVEVLVKSGANVNATEFSRGHTALMWAAAERHSRVVELLIEYGADVNARSKREVAAQGSAKADDARSSVQSGCPEFVLPPRPVFGLPGRARRTNAKSAGGCITPLILAARQNDEDSVRILLEAGADVNLTMADGTSALLVAIHNAHYEIAALLLERGGDPNIADGKGMTALYAAVDMRNHGTTDVPRAKPDAMDPLDLIKSILAHGADVNARLTMKVPYRGGTNPTWQSEVGATPFVRAAYSNDIVVMRLLLAYGADPNLYTSNGTTPLMAAAGVGWLPKLTYTRNENLIETLQLCLDLGNDVDATNNGNPDPGGPTGLTALHGAAFKGLPEAVQFLVDNGADIYAEDSADTGGGARSEGRTPLDWAVGVYFEGQPPRREPRTEALLRALMEVSDEGAKSDKSR